MLSSIASGQREFQPDPIDAKEASRQNYKVKRTLIMRFDDDSIDESYDIKNALLERKESSGWFTIIYVIFYILFFMYFWAPEFYVTHENLFLI